MPNMESNQAMQSPMVQYPRPPPRRTVFTPNPGYHTGPVHSPLPPSGVPDRMEAPPPAPFYNPFVNDGGIVYNPFTNQWVPQVQDDWTYTGYQQQMSYTHRITAPAMNNGYAVRPSPYAATAPAAPPMTDYYAVRPSPYAPIASAPPSRDDHPGLLPPSTMPPFRVPVPRMTNATPIHPQMVASPTAAEPIMTASPPVSNLLTTIAQGNSSSDGSPTPPVRRGPGRPLGAKNRDKTVPLPPKIPKKRGRPLGVHNKPKDPNAPPKQKKARIMGRKPNNGDTIDVEQQPLPVSEGPSPVDPAIEDSAFSLDMSPAGISALVAFNSMNPSPNDPTSLDASPDSNPPLETSTPIESTAAGSDPTASQAPTWQSLTIDPALLGDSNPSDSSSTSPLTDFSTPNSTPPTVTSSTAPGIPTLTSTTSPGGEDRILPYAYPEPGLENVQCYDPATLDHVFNAMQQNSKMMLPGDGNSMAEYKEIMPNGDGIRWTGSKYERVEIPTE